MFSKIIILIIYNSKILYNSKINITYLLSINVAIFTQFLFAVKHINGYDYIFQIFLLILIIAKNLFHNEIKIDLSKGHLKQIICSDINPKTYTLSKMLVNIAHATLITFIFSIFTLIFLMYCKEQIIAKQFLIPAVIVTIYVIYNSLMELIPLLKRKIEIMIFLLGTAIANSFHQYLFLTFNQNAMQQQNYIDQALLLFSLIAGIIFYGHFMIKKSIFRYKIRK